MLLDFNKLALNEQAVISHIPKSYQGVVVSCSGGVDSVVLFHEMLAFTKSKINFSMHAVHVNYRLRGSDSDGDQAFVEALCHRYNVPCEVYVVTDDELAECRDGKGIQAWARAIRRRLFAEWSQRGYVIALGHHLDDLAETIIFRLARGVAPENMAGMSLFSPPLWRPFLRIPKSEILNVAKTNGISFREDASNAKMEYARNVIRQKILPELEALFPGALERLTACAEETRDLAVFCRQQLSVDADFTAQDGIDVVKLLRLPRGAALIVLQQAIHQYIGSGRQLTRKNMTSLLEMLSKVSQTTDRQRLMDLRLGVYAEVQFGRLFFRHDQVYPGGFPINSALKLQDHSKGVDVHG